MTIFFASAMSGRRKSSKKRVAELPAVTNSTIDPPIAGSRYVAVLRRRHLMALPSCLVVLVVRYLSVGDHMRLCTVSKALAEIAKRPTSFEIMKLTRRQVLEGAMNKLVFARPHSPCHCPGAGLTLC